MHSQAQGYELAEVPGEPDSVHVSNEQADSALSLTSTLSNDSPNSSTPAPQRLRRIQFLSLSAQLLLTIFPILFIALAARAVSLDQKKTSPEGRMVQQAISLSPTVFPIVFAAIVGKTFRVLGLFGVERGIKLGTLERLVGSQSLPATIERQVTLRGQSFLGVLMVFLWVLSPLGGQSALRLLHVVPGVISTNATIRYLPIAASTMSAMLGAPPTIMMWSSYGPIYMTALTASRNQLNSSQDLFGNLRIPSLDSLAPPYRNVNKVWTTVDYNRTVPYSSLLGIPVVGIPATGNISFNIVSRYLAIDCDSALHKTNSSVFLNTTTEMGPGFATYYQGASFLVQGEDPSRNMDNSFLRFNISSPNDGNHRDISFISCSLAPRDVESSVFCRDQSCQVTAIRNLTVDTDLWCYYDCWNIIRSFWVLPQTTVGIMHEATKTGSSITELWLQHPYTNVVAKSYNTYSNLSQIPLPTLSRNLEVLYNTFWQSTIGSQYLLGNLSPNMSLYDNITNGANLPFDFNSTQATITRLTGEKYTCNKTFAAFLLVVSCILFLASILSLVLMNMTLAPDVLGYVSSYTRDNPFAPADQASHLDGLERARAMKDVKVILGDVNAGSDIGHVAFALASKAQKLRKDKVYD